MLPESSSSIALFTAACCCSISSYVGLVTTFVLLLSGVSFTFDQIHSPQIMPVTETTTSVHNSVQLAVILTTFIKLLGL